MEVARERLVWHATGAECIYVFTEKGEGTRIYLALRPDLYNSDWARWAHPEFG